MFKLSSLSLKELMAWGDNLGLIKYQGYVLKYNIIGNSLVFYWIT